MAERIPVDTLISVSFRPVVAVQGANHQTGPVYHDLPLPPWQPCQPQKREDRIRLSRTITSRLHDLLLARLKED